jgi:glyoxylase-like metal-dependent hydrolase (beta-lactamase superfamily II)
MRWMALGLLVVGCAEGTVPRPVSSADRPAVVQLDVGKGTNAYLLFGGAKPILIDTGWGDSTAALESALALHKVTPAELGLIVVTHGHGDHAGGAKRMRELSKAQVIAAQADVPKLEAGRNGPMNATSTLGRVLRGSSDKPFPAFTPDLVIAGELSLAPYGIDGVLIPEPGHTPGSLAVLLHDGDAIVGDMFRGGLLRGSRPERHFFHEDCARAESHVAELVERGAKRFYVGHGGPIDAQRALTKFQADTCPHD